MPTRPCMAGMLVLTCAIACGGDNATTLEEETTTGAATTTTTTTTTANTEPIEEECTPGYEGCACAEGDLCLAGLSCLSQLCVDAGQPGTTTDAEGSTTSALTAEDSGSTTSSATTPSDESSSSETTAVEPECLEGDNYCADGEIQTCVDGFWDVRTCEEHCLLIGYHSPGCANADGCTCEGFADTPCENGSLGLCYCAEIDFGLLCDMEQWTEFYDQCIAGVDYAVCFIDYPYDGGNIDCATAEAACGL